MIPTPEYPASAEWGPIIWNVLHGLAEKAQRSSLHADEIREWVRLIKTTSEMIPCDICRGHMIQYMKEHRFEDIPFNVLKERIATWFFNLHNEINEGNGRPLFSYDNLSEKYGKIDIQDMLWRLDPVIKKAVQLNGVGLVKYMNWVKSVKMMRAILQI